MHFQTKLHVSFINDELLLLLTNSLHCLLQAIIYFSKSLIHFNYC